jgi:hypothetical protein
MSCCGKTKTAAMTERHRIRVRYGGGRPIIVKGPATGSDYRFSGTERVQLVDPRDAAAIVHNRMFRVEGVIEIPTS